MDMETPTSELYSNRATKRDFVIAAFTLMFVLLIGGVIFYKFGMSHNPIPANMRKQASFTAYYPAALPHDWHIDTGSYIGSSKTIIYRIVGKMSEPELSISLQIPSGDFDYDSFYQKSLKNSVRLTLPAGTAVIGTGANQLIGSLLTKDTWVITTALSPNVTQSDIRQVLTGLRH